MCNLNFQTRGSLIVHRALNRCGKMCVDVENDCAVPSPIIPIAKFNGVEVLENMEIEHSIMVLEGNLEKPQVTQSTSNECADKEFDEDVFSLNDECESVGYDSDADPEWDPENYRPNSEDWRTSGLLLQNESESKNDDVSCQIPETDHKRSGKNSEGQAVSATEIPSSCVPNREGRKSKLSKRENQKRKKDCGLEYVTRKGVVVPAKTFVPAVACCRKMCHESFPKERQTEIFSEFLKKSGNIKKEILSNRIIVSEKKSERKGRGKKDIQHKREISVNYLLTIKENQTIKVCKKMFSHVQGLSRAQVDNLVSKKKSSKTGFIDPDCRGKHEPKNKKTEERNFIRQFIDAYPKYESHYSRKRSKKLYLPSNLNIKKMYDEYKDLKKKASETHVSYDVFKQVFKETGYAFKAPKVDTCKTCDVFVLKLKQSVPGEKDNIEKEFEEHKRMADLAYKKKDEDKKSAAEDKSKRVIVFDLQQVLNTPSLSTNIAYYKRLLSTYNLTVRDCSEDGHTECYMWHEALGGRGSDQIASCIFQKIKSLPANVHHLITYSDTCGGQNRNANMSAMFSLACSQSPSLQVIDQKFLLPGHTHLECDSDHARIEKAKKFTSVPIMVPRDWFQFVRTVRGKKPFQVIEMNQDNFISFSQLYSAGQKLVKRTNDKDGNKIQWLNIKWMRHEKDFGVIKFKYTLEDNEPFKTMDLRRRVKGRPSLPEVLPLSYHASLPVNPLKKKDLLSLLPLIHRDFHEFYQNLKTAHTAVELDIETSEDSDSD